VRAALRPGRARGAARRAPPAGAARRGRCRRARRRGQAIAPRAPRRPVPAAWGCSGRARAAADPECAARGRARTHLEARTDRRPRGGPRAAAEPCEQLARMEAAILPLLRGWSARGGVACREPDQSGGGRGVYWGAAAAIGGARLPAAGGPGRGGVGGALDARSRCTVAWRLGPRPVTKRPQFASTLGSLAPSSPGAAGRRPPPTPAGRRPPPPAAAARRPPLRGPGPRPRAMADLDALLGACLGFDNAVRPARQRAAGAGPGGGRGRGRRGAGGAPPPPAPARPPRPARRPPSIPRPRVRRAPLPRAGAQGGGAPAAAAVGPPRVRARAVPAPRGGRAPSAPAGGGAAAQGRRPAVPAAHARGGAWCGWGHSGGGLGTRHKGSRAGSAA
jgi:hypothetical protein